MAYTCISDREVVTGGSVTQHRLLRRGLYIYLERLVFTQMTHTYLNLGSNRGN